MPLACRLVLTIEDESAVRPPSLDYPTLRSLMERTPEIQARPDGSLAYVFQMTAQEVATAQRIARLEVDRPTPDGLASCLSALAREAQELGLGGASWAIDLAMQMIRLQEVGGEGGHSA